MSVHDAELGDIYVDDAGKLWRVTALCGEPTVHVEEIETKTPESPVKRSGGVSGYMWTGFKRIHRLEKSSQTLPAVDVPKTGNIAFPAHYDSQGYCDNPGRGY